MVWYGNKVPSLLGSHEALWGLNCCDDGQGNQRGYRPFEVHDEGVLRRLHRLY